MRRTIITLGLGILGVAFGFAAAALPDDFVFTTFDVPFTTTFSPVRTHAFGINVLGQVVGSYSDSQISIPSEHGYLRDPDGRFTPIDVPFAGAFGTRPRAINAPGVIVGRYSDGPGLAAGHCFIRTPEGLFTTLDFPNGIDTVCLGINNRGQIVGRARDPITLRNHGFLFSDDVFTRIDFPGATSTFGDEINDHGQIVGAYTKFPLTTRLHSFILDKEGQFTLVDFPGAIETSAYGINARGEIVGGYADSENFVHGFLFTRGVYTTVPLPGVPQNLGSFTIPTTGFPADIYGIADNGMITGVSLSTDGNHHGFLGVPVHSPDQ